MKRIPEFPRHTALGLDHQPLIQQRLQARSIRSSDYAYYNLSGWFLEVPPTISRYEDALILGVEGPEGKPLYLAPLGEAPIQPALSAMLATPGQTGAPLSVRYVPQVLCEEIRQAVPVARIEAQRDDYDYLYDRAEIASLAGRKFHQKKNFVNRVSEEEKPEVERLEARHLPEVEEFLSGWYADFGNDDVTVRIEALAARRNLPLLDAMGGRGIVVRIGGRVAGVSVATPVHSACWVVTLEKADRAVKGLYQYLNWALVNHLPPEVTVVNRETDLGLAGLRTAKLSYHPVGFEEKFTVWFP